MRESGQTPEQLPMMAITFYDAKRAMVGQRGLGPWQGTFDWKHEDGRMRVPTERPRGIVRIGLLGGVGEVVVRRRADRAVRQRQTKDRCRRVDGRTLSTL